MLALNSIGVISTVVAGEIGLVTHCGMSIAIAGSIVVQVDSSTHGEGLLRSSSLLLTADLLHVFC